MSVFLLGDDHSFPDPRGADDDIIAVGGDLSTERLITAYSRGIFPWFNEDDPIVWWSPDPRFVLYPEKVKISRSMRKVIRNNTFTITYDRAFEDVMRGCMKPREKQSGETWITGEMFEAYTGLFHKGYAHSVEVWHGDELAGGLYGVSLGNAFFGESMFSRRPDSSKTALIHLSLILTSLNFSFIDCQVYTSHLESMGAEHVERNDFLDSLEDSLSHETLSGSWEEYSNITWKDLKLSV